MTAPTAAWSLSSFTVSWDGADEPSECGGIDKFKVQYSTDNVNWHDWKETSDKSAQWEGGINNTTYYFRVKARDNSGNESGYSPPSQTKVDSEPPNVPP